MTNFTATVKFDYYFSRIIIVPMFAMLTWEELCKHDCKYVAVAFGRHSHVEADYKQHMFELAARGVTIDEYIRDSVMCGRPTALVHNAFPYAMEPGISHYVYWMHPA